ncbi:hypothetical protein [Nocardioides zeicaulis]|uniref:Uncharacterized protein n=1 Tax=Nocardioides zeicaulis TaxID=1776857 RepID=A0ABV6E420_9ACTN
MDNSRDIIESSRPPKPPRAGQSGEPGTPPTARVLPLTVALATLACAAFTGITAWEVHQDRVNNQRIYCTFYVDSLSDNEGVAEDEVRRIRELGAELDC